MKTTRRSFMKMLLLSGTASTSLFALNSATGINFLSLKGNPKHELRPDETHIYDSTDIENPLPNEANMALGMIIDLNKCDGCIDDKVYQPAIQSYEPRCTAACRTMHNVPPEQEWIKIYYKKDNPLTEGYYFPRPCMQCQRPPCVRVCPVGAAYHRPLNYDGTGPGDGLVLIKYNRCIGCRMCMAGCPYGVRYFNWASYDEPDKSVLKYHSPMYATKRTIGTVEKCDFCAHLGYGGKLSACTQACPKGAIYYGNLKQNSVTNAKLESIKVHETITEKTGFRLKEEIGTKPRVYYLPKSS